MLIDPARGGPRLGRLPIGPDPLRRIRVPRDLGPLVTRSDREADPAAAGMTRTDVARIWSDVLRLYRYGMHPAISLCVRRNGVVVLDRAIGWARGVGPSTPRGRTGVAATPDTPYCVFSTSKALTATVVHLLGERGALHIGDRVVDYLPEFSGEGRDQITIEQVLSHRAGIPNVPRELIDLDRLDEPGFVLSALATMRVRGRPGSSLAYHAVSGGFVLGEVVRRAAGKDIRAVLAEEILEPLGFRWSNFGVAPADLPSVGLGYPTGPALLPPVSGALTRAFGMAPDDVTRIANDPRFLTGIVPAASVVSTANELSRFMDLLRAGGTLDGVTVLAPRTIRRAVRERSYHEFDRTLGAPLRHASGYMLGARALGVFGPDTDEAFGHLGFTNVMAWADPRRELAVGLIASGKPFLAPHLGALWRLTRRIGLAAPKVADPVLYRS